MFFGGDKNWGVYREDGTLVKYAAYTRGNPHELVGQSWKTPQDWSQLQEAPPYDYIYAGPAVPHYGHFVLTSLSRLWPFLAKKPRKTKILYHAYGQPDELFKTPFVREFLGALDLTPDDLAVFQRPVRLRSLTVPAASFNELASAHQIFADLCHQIGHRLLARSGIASGGKPIYLAKTKLTYGVGRLTNEAELLMQLGRKLEFDVVCPETLPIAAQVALFASKRLILGTTSSAFHTSIFSDSMPELVGISMRPSVPSNFSMIDQLNHNAATYVYLENGFAQHEPPDSFMECFEAINVENCANEINQFLRTKI